MPEAIAPPPVQRITANGIELAYQTFGDPAATPIVLVMGLNTPMAAWGDELCADLAEHGYYVVRFDNRDVGLSSHLNDLPVPNIYRVVLTRQRPPYSIDDFATDTLALLDALGLEQVHLVGASMGGFIAQTVALRAPERLLSLTLMMTSTGSRRVGWASRRLVSTVLRRRPATTREEAITTTLTMMRLIASPGYPFEQDRVTEFANLNYDNGYDPAAQVRQFAAVLGQPNRTEALANLDVPTLVMHGLSDPLVHPSGGVALARTIPGAKLVGFHGMAHDLPRALWPDFVREMVAIAQLGESRAARGEHPA